MASCNVPLSKEHYIIIIEDPITRTDKILHTIPPIWKRGITLHPMSLVENWRDEARHMIALYRREDIVRGTIFGKAVVPDVRSSRDG